MKKVIVSGVVAVLVALLAATVVFANGALLESGDAGQLPATAQVASGTGPLNSITGGIDQVAVADVDMYQICLEGGGSFSASIDGFPIFNTQLFLFDSAGLGVYSNDDITSINNQSLLPAVDPLTPAAAGIYYLAISGYDNDPLSTGGLIFPADITGPPQGPIGPGGGSPFSSWNGNGGAGGGYTINLTGAFEVNDGACVFPVRVGGATSFLASSDSSSIALLAGGVVAVVAVTAGGWYTRKRWLRS